MKRMEEQFLEYVKKMMGYHEAIGLMYWDLRTGAPKKGVGQRSEVIGMLSAEAFQMSISEEMAAFIAKLSAKGVYEQLGEVTQRTLDECKKNMSAIKNSRCRIQGVCSASLQSGKRLGRGESNR